LRGWHAGSFHNVSSMLQLIHAPIARPDASLGEVVLTVERITLAKRIWRGTAADGVEFGFEVEVSLEIAPSAAAGIGWAVGNLHLELQAEPTRLLAPDEPAARQLLERLNVPFRQTTAIFRPGRFARGNQSTHELGPSHKH
jgi:urease accessory protein